MSRCGLLTLALGFLFLLWPVAAQADVTEFTDKVVNKTKNVATKVGSGVEKAATKTGEKIERAGAKIQTGASSTGSKARSGANRADGAIVEKAQPVQDKLASNVYVLTRTTELRTGRGPKAHMIRSFQAGAQVVVDDWSDDGRWAHVRIRDGGKVHEGWVPKANLKKQDK